MEYSKFATTKVSVRKSRRLQSPSALPSAEISSHALNRDFFRYRDRLAQVRRSDGTDNQRVNERLAQDKLDGRSRFEATADRRCEPRRGRRGKERC